MQSATVTQPPIAQIAQTIVEALHPERIVLFGSRAREDAGPDSDVDLMVEMESRLPPHERAKHVYRLFHPRHWSMDVLVYTPDEASKFRHQRYSMLAEIERTGRVLYERRPS
jgi:predicted nucleotidyltransferase